VYSNELHYTRWLFSCALARSLRFEVHGDGRHTSRAPGARWIRLRLIWRACVDGGAAAVGSWSPRGEARLVSVTPLCSALSASRPVVTAGRADGGQRGTGTFSVLPPLTGGACWGGVATSGPRLPLMGVRSSTNALPFC